MELWVMGALTFALEQEAGWGKGGEGSAEEFVGLVSEWGCMRQTPDRPVLLLTG